MHQDNYLPRLIDPVLEKYLSLFYAVELAGPLFCGKTTSALQYAGSVLDLSNLDIRDNVYASPTWALEGVNSHVLDEWQFVPGIWDEVRAAVDAESLRGESPAKSKQFILTSSTRLEKTHEILHSGAGRIARLRLRPMSLVESGDSTGAISLKTLFDTGAIEAAHNGQNTRRSQMTLPKLAALCVRGGLPHTVRLEPEAAQNELKTYLKRCIQISDIDIPMSPSVMQKFAAILAENLGSALKIKNVVDQIFGKSLSVSEETKRLRVQKMLSYFLNKYVIEECHGWDAPIKSKQRLRSKPKYDFCDPGVLCAILGANEDRLLENSQLLGQVFEQLVLRDLRVYLEAYDYDQAGQLYYYRDNKGLEADAILELDDGRWAAIEVKLGVNKAPEAAQNLLRIKEKIARNALARAREPEFLMVVVGIGAGAMTTPDGVHIVPIDLLGP